MSKGDYNGRHLFFFFLNYSYYIVAKYQTSDYVERGDLLTSVKGFPDKKFWKVVNETEGTEERLKRYCRR